MNDSKYEILEDGLNLKILESFFRKCLQRTKKNFSSDFIFSKFENVEVYSWKSFLAHLEYILVFKKFYVIFDGFLRVTLRVIFYPGIF